jgi:hypothetical protein
MNKEQLASYQMEGQYAMLSSLIMRCRERFLRAGSLVQMPTPALDKVRQFGLVEKYDIACLLPAWYLLCNRYLNEIYSPQMGMFAEIEVEKADAWDRFVYNQLFPRLVRDDEFVRDILRVFGVLPCKSQSGAIEALQQYFREFALPTETDPRWPDEKDEWL